METKAKENKATAVKAEKTPKAPKAPKAAVEQVKITNVDELLEHVCKQKSENFSIAKPKVGSDLATELQAKPFEHILVAEKQKTIVKFVWDTREVTGVIANAKLFPLKGEELVAKVRDSKKPLVSTDKAIRAELTKLI